MLMVPRQWRSASSHHGSQQRRSPPAPQENNGDISTLPKTIGAVSSQGLATSGLFRAKGTHAPSSPWPCHNWGTCPSRLIQDCWDAGTFPTSPFYCPLWPPPRASLEWHLLPVSSWLVHCLWDARMERLSPKKLLQPIQLHLPVCFPFPSPFLSAFTLDEIQLTSGEERCHLQGQQTFVSCSRRQSGMEQHSNALLVQGHDMDPHSGNLHSQPRPSLNPNLNFW